MQALTQKLSMERRLLQSQMDPHFVFNALGNIQSFVLQNETKNAVTYLATFSKLMRQILVHSKSESVSLADEIDTLKNYIVLQQLRLNHSFDYTINDDAIENLQTHIPPMLIQPFVENAIEHGLKPLDNATKGHLQISFTENESSIECTIIDNGVGYQFSKSNTQNNSHKHQSLTASTVAASGEDYVALLMTDDFFWAEINAIMFAANNYGIDAMQYVYDKYQISSGDYSASCMAFAERNPGFPPDNVMQYQDEKMEEYNQIFSKETGGNVADDVAF